MEGNLPQQEGATPSPVGTQATGKQNPRNKDGFIKGSEVKEADYYLHLARMRQAKKK